jgi:hypothetical protein
MPEENIRFKKGDGGSAPCRLDTTLHPRLERAQDIAAVSMPISLSLSLSLYTHAIDIYSSMQKV